MSESEFSPSAESDLSPQSLGIVLSLTDSLLLSSNLQGNVFLWSHSYGASPPYPRSAQRLWMDGFRSVNFPKWAMFLIVDSVQKSGLCLVFTRTAKVLCRRGFARQSERVCIYSEIHLPTKAIVSVVLASLFLRPSVTHWTRSVNRLHYPHYLPEKTIE